MVRVKDVPHSQRLTKVAKAMLIVLARLQREHDGSSAVRTSLMELCVAIRIAAGAEAGPSFQSMREGFRRLEGAGWIKRELVNQAAGEWEITFLRDVSSLAGAK